MRDDVPAWMQCRAARWTVIGVLLICLAMLYATGSDVASF